MCTAEGVRKRHSPLGARDLAEPAGLMASIPLRVKGIAAARMAALFGTLCGLLRSDDMNVILGRCGIG